MTEDEAKPTTTGKATNPTSEPDGYADRATGTDPGSERLPPEVREALTLYAVARRDLYLADNLTRSA